MLFSHFDVSYLVNLMCVSSEKLNSLRMCGKQVRCSNSDRIDQSNIPNVTCSGPCFGLIITKICDLWLPDYLKS